LKRNSVIYEVYSLHFLEFKHIDNLDHDSILLFSLSAFILSSS
jgi:hypothetical protein